jgi:hypothetical protein
MTGDKSKLWRMIRKSMQRFSDKIMRKQDEMNRHGNSGMT